MKIWYYIGFGVLLLFIMGAIVWLVMDMIKEKKNPVIKKKKLIIFSFVLPPFHDINDRVS
ncbi:hypothetical protein SAMN05216464_1062 [Mucilaginibacter pineti]|uniref:Uncharacterized protein n=1 Tax=Mucilaginibacter pineti TaxID=1391627 RepID=A0A1G7CN41_9SPHI|nr:hypothetical protein [Mucilaginibacter pineti]SDE40086.1 hypothetical protein SAMN05216464_1062 [Mucilaginibacter pineti]